MYHSFRRGWRSEGYEDLITNKFPTPPWGVSATFPQPAPHPPLLKYPYRNDLVLPGREYFAVSATASATSTATETGTTLRTRTLTVVGLALASAAVLPQVVNIPWAKKKDWAA